MLSTVTTTASPKRPRWRRKPVPTVAPAVDHRTVLACRLDRNADVLLSQHCHLAAERLSLRAQTLRVAGGAQMSPPRLREVPPSPHILAKATMQTSGRQMMGAGEDQS